MDNGTKGTKGQGDKGTQVHRDHKAMGQRAKRTTAIDHWDKGIKKQRDEEKTTQKGKRKKKTLGQ